MNKFFFKVVIFISFLSMTQVRAQQYFQPELTVGGFAGVTLSQVSFSPKIKENYLTGYTAGVKLRYISEKHLGFLIEPNYSLYGWSENFKEYVFTQEENYEYSRKLHYFELPFMTHVYFGNKQRFFFNLGPIVRILLSDKENINFNPESIPQDHYGQGAYGNSIDKKFDYGIGVGLGMELRTKKGYFMLEGRYYYGLGDIFGNHKKDFYAKSANQNISITLSYLLPWGGIKKIAF